MRRAIANSVLGAMLLATIFTMGCDGRADYATNQGANQQVASRDRADDDRSSGGYSGDASADGSDDGGFDYAGSSFSRDESAPVSEDLLPAPSEGAPAGPGTSASTSAPAPHRATSRVSSRPAKPEAAKSSTAGDDAKRESKTPRQQQIQSGTLTAGSYDDQLNFDHYQEFLSKLLQNDIDEIFPRFALGKRVVIQVADEQRRAVGGVQVTVHAADSQTGEALFSSVTASDGRVVFLTGIDDRGGNQRFRISVTPPDGGAATTKTAALDGDTWQVTLADAEAKLPERLDLALVVDTTGSMGDELEYLKVEIDSIAESVDRMFPGVDQRYALVVYRDQGDEYVTRTFDFTGSLKEFRGHLSSQSAGGGGDYPEAMHLAVEHAGKLDWRDGDTARVMFLVGDAPPHDQDAGRTIDAVQQLRSRGVRIYPVAGSGVAVKAEFVMRAMSFLTMGQYLFLTDHSGVGNPHAKPNVPEYQVERLDRLMTRMIASELAGKRLAPKEVIAIERGDAWPSTPIIDEQQGPADNAGAAVDRTSVDKRIASMGPIAWVLLGAVFVGVFACDALRDRRQRAEME